MKSVVYVIAGLLGNTHILNENYYCRKARLTAGHYVYMHVVSVSLHAGKLLASLSFFIVFLALHFTLANTSLNE